MSEPEFITVNDFTKRYATGRTKLYELIAAGDIEARKSGSKTLLVFASVKRWAAALPKVG